MILTWNEICKQFLNWSIYIEPFNKEQVTTNSYDLCLGKNLIKYTSSLLDPKRKNEFEILTIPEEWFVMEKWMFLLWSSEEIIWSDFFVPIIHTKSSIARLWLFAHITADLIDIWSRWQFTFQLFATLPVILYPGMKVAQVSFRVPKWKIELYNGKYMNSKWPQASKIHLS